MLFCRNRIIYPLLFLISSFFLSVFCVRWEPKIIIYDSTNCTRNNFYLNVFLIKYYLFFCINLLLFHKIWFFIMNKFIFFFLASLLLVATCKHASNAPKREESHKFLHMERLPMVRHLFVIYCNIGDYFERLQMFYSVRLEWLLTNELRPFI